MKLDPFSEIASRRAANRAHLKSPSPLAKPSNTLPLGAFDSSSEWRMTRKIRTQSDLEQELKRQRAIHAPFLQKFSPPETFQRRKQPLVCWKWRMETTEDRLKFSDVLEGKGHWEDVTIPHYGGPVGIAVAYYRTEVEIPHLQDGTEWMLCFEAADYLARVYCNGRCVGQHEGFFAPFEFSVAPFLIPGATNTILVELHNDAICMGVKLDDGTMIDGDKLYAATGLGWDDPIRGWHHCPPGMGIFGQVHLEARAHSYVSHAWVRTLDLEGNIEVFLELSGRDSANPPVTVEYAIYGENFEATLQEATLVPLSHPVGRGENIGRDPVGRGPNLYRISTHIPRIRLWHPDSPWLYSLQVTLKDEDRVIDGHSCVFGVRTFELQTDSEPKGRFFLNGKELRLMGANTMGFEQQDVMRGDFAQLRDDILLAKMCNMNFLRLTQRPVQSAVYEMCDRLGLMTQSDLPLFAVLRRPQFAEAVKQAGEMERMLCPHACNIVVSYINEPFPAEWATALTRSLTREELERFFVAADQMILSINPDRVIKPTDGDYDPPAPGLPDNHSYTLWYVGHEIDAGMLHAGHWIPVKPGWNYACGEFGAEGLDFSDLMRRRYPIGWLPSIEEEWDPSKIIDAQTGSHFCFFYDRQKTVEGWVNASHAHQAFAVRFMSEAFRRDRRMVSFAVHLFIDAWPAGWMKSIMDCERRAKPAWFAYRDALSPVHVSLRTDRFTCFSGEVANAEIWVANDSGSLLAGAEVKYQILNKGVVIAGGSQVLPDILSPDVFGAGVVRFHTPETSTLTEIEFRAGVIDSLGNTLHDASISLKVYPALPTDPTPINIPLGFSIPWLQGNFRSRAVDLADLLHREIIVCNDSYQLREAWPKLLQSAREGARVIVMDLQPGVWEIEKGQNAVIEACGMGARHFVSRDTGHPVVEGFEAEDFRFWFDDEVGFITPLLKNLIVGPGGNSILSSGQLGWGLPLTFADAVREYAIGAGSIVLCCLELKGHLSNPVALRFLERLIRPLSGESEEIRSAEFATAADAEITQRNLATGKSREAFYCSVES